MYLKKEFYQIHVDKEFNTMFQKGKESLEDFNNYCSFYNSLGVLGYQGNQIKPLQKFKRYSYLFFLLTIPMKMRY